MKILWIVILSLALLLTACTSPQATGEAPVTGSEGTPAAGAQDTPAGDTTGGAAGGTAGTCANVDTAQLVETGEAVYTANCASCHGAQGEGQGDFPALAGSANVTVEDVPGLIARYFSVPAHPKTVSTDDVAAVLTYVRSSFGNTAPAVCPDVVLENRPAQ